MNQNNNKILAKFHNKISRLQTKITRLQTKNRKFKKDKEQLLLNLEGAETSKKKLEEKLDAVRYESENKRGKRNPENKASGVSQTTGTNIRGKNRKNKASGGSQTLETNITTKGKILTQNAKTPLGRSNIADRKHKIMNLLPTQTPAGSNRSSSGRPLRNSSRNDFYN